MMARFKVNIGKIITCFVIVFGFAALVPAHSSALFEDAKNAACGGADSVVKCGGDPAGSLNTKIRNAINLISIIVGIAAVIMIIVSGFRFVTSGGDSNAVSSARNGIIFAAVGLFVVAMAQAIVRFVLGKT